MLWAYTEKDMEARSVGRAGGIAQTREMIAEWLWKQGHGDLAAQVRDDQFYPLPEPAERVCDRGRASCAPSDCECFVPVVDRVGANDDPDAGPLPGLSRENPRCTRCGNGAFAWASGDGGVIACTQCGTRHANPDPTRPL